MGWKSKQEVEAYDDTEIQQTISELSDMVASSIVSGDTIKIDGRLDGATDGLLKMYSKNQIDSTSADLRVSIEGSSIVLPMEIRGNKKEFLFTTATNLAANAVFISPVFDFINDKTLNGLVTTSHDGTLYIQESDDQYVWTNVQTIPVTAATSAVISSITYYDSIQFSKQVSTRFVRLVYVNGATAQTRFLLNAYSASI